MLYEHTPQWVSHRLQRKKLPIIGDGQALMDITCGLLWLRSIDRSIDPAESSCLRGSGRVRARSGLPCGSYVDNVVHAIELAIRVFVVLSALPSAALSGPRGRHCPAVRCLRHRLASVPAPCAIVPSPHARAATAPPRRRSAVCSTSRTASRSLSRLWWSASARRCAGFCTD